MVRAAAKDQATSSAWLTEKPSHGSPKGRPLNVWQPPPWLLEAQGATASASAPAPLDDGAAGRWSSRPVLSALVRLAAFGSTVCSSIAAAVGLGWLLPQPVGSTGVLFWWLTVLLGSGVALVAADRLARRLLLPFAALLELSLAFPDRAPSRPWIALRVATVRDARRRIESPDSRDFSDDPFRAAVMVIALVGAMTTHCRCTRGHSERVRAFTDLLADQLRLPDHDRDRLRWAALLHDVGKLHVSPRILNKPGTPTSDEWQVLKRHPQHGARIAAPLREWLGPWADAIEQHHERWDGGGYPSGLAGEEISLGARVVAVADAFDVMTTTRPYQGPVSIREARQELARNAAGTQFDPAVVRAFLQIPTDQLRKLVTPVAWAVQLPLLALVPRIEVAAAMAREAVITLGAATAIGVLGASGAIEGNPVRRPPAVQVASPGAPALRAPVPPPSLTLSATRDNQAAGRTSQPPAPAPASVGSGGQGDRPSSTLEDRLPVPLPAVAHDALATIEDLIPAVPEPVISPVQDLQATVEGSVDTFTAPLPR